MGIIRQVWSRFGGKLAISSISPSPSAGKPRSRSGAIDSYLDGLLQRRNFSSKSFFIESAGLDCRKLSQRSYYVDRYGVRHFEQRSLGGMRGWANAGGGVSQKFLLVAGCIGGFMVYFYYTHLEVVPYTNRKHLVLISPQMEAMLGETTFNNMKKQFQNRILPPYHPAVVRVARIAQNSINSAMEGIHATGKNQLEYTPDVSKKLPSARSRDYVLGPAEDVEQPTFFMKLGEKDLYRENESAVDDVWVEDCRKTAKEKGRKAQTQHVDHFKWEIVVVDANVVNAACLPGGKIIVFTGLLKAFPHDEELATVLGHEVGHAIARHTGEMLTRSIFIGFIELLFLVVVQAPNIVGPASDLLLRLPFSRKMEIEADHIGALVMAAAGYDPRIAPGVYLKLGELQKLPEYVQYISTHPSGRTRAEGLLKSQTLKEATRIYLSKQGGWESSGFLM
ncbi:mitochondrial metalloendopeptidase OMA1 [Selaginella moellendorffii]|nr:mitochondrial metalloendopeptidase OMA1 [Selaginella moellendorffii]|eukprot:XP_024537560.1 mitochondrial metalloendopeptidase OMA1 [Selaginella moellendorffii]